MKKRLLSALLMAAVATGTLWAVPSAMAQPGPGMGPGPRPGMGPGSGLGPGPGYARTVLCESQDGRYHECRMPGDARRVQLVRQVSDTRCVEGRNWGQRGGRVWVDKGCRGEFADVGRGRHAPIRYSVTCESNDQRVNTCNWDSRQGTPRLAEQLSSTNCRKGESWGTDRRGDIWVSRGCRARFESR